MSLEPGQSIGPHKVVRLLGEGGMGQVWQATDTQLNRQVALKILPDAFAADPDRLARFTREAQILARLNHPNIAAIYGIEESEGTRALVLELVEGPTLADRIAHGAMPIEDALPIARQIAEALEAAHEQGVIHRDLKPANIKVKDDGTVKVLDFGLAKALDPAPDVDPDESPTLTAAATQMGVIMGTAAYMSPEQARGKPVDKRADIWAFGVVLYEMLASGRAFDGTNTTDILGAVLKLDPDWAALPRELPDALRKVLDRCLAKDPDRRQRDAGDIRLDLEAAVHEHAAPSQGKASGSRRVAGLVPWVMTAVLGAVVLGFLLRDVTPSATPPSTRRFALDLPWKNMPNWGDFRARVSPQGTHLAYPGSDENRTTIYLRAFDSLEAITLVSPSADPWNLVFSPDGERLAFFTGLQLQTVSIRGGQPESLLDLRDSATAGDGGPDRAVGLSWGDDGSILMGGRDGLLRVSTSYGAAELVAAAPDGEGYTDPFHLPNGDHALVSIFRPPSLPRLAVVDLVTGTVRELAFQGVEPIYSPTGHVLFRQDGELFAFPFDLDSLEARGQAVAIAGGIAYGPRMSEDGTLVYVAERVAGSAGLVWVDRQGTASPIPGERRDYTHIDLSEDGARALLNIDGTVLPEIYARDLNRGSRRLVSNGGFPIWSSDGTELYFRQGSKVMSAKVVLAPEIDVAPSELLFDGPYTLDLSGHQRYDVAPDGRFLMVENSEDFRVVVVEGFFEEWKRLVPVD